MNTIHKLTLRSLLMNKSRTAMTIVAIMLSCALITVVAGMGTSAWQSFINSNINSYGDYDVYFEGKFTDKNVNDLKINRDVDGIYYERYVGVAGIPKPVSAFKPYMLIRGLNKGALDKCFQAKLSEGRLPENDSEIVLSPMFVRYSVKEYHTGDKLTLDVGYRTISSDSSAQSRTLDFVSAYAKDNEALAIQAKREYTVVGILSSVSDRISLRGGAACVDVYTLTDSIDNIPTYMGAENNTVNELWVNYTDSMEKDFVNATAQIVGISKAEAQKHFDNAYIFPEIEFDENGNEIVNESIKTEYDLAMEKIAASNHFGITNFQENWSVLAIKGIVYEGHSKEIFLTVAAVLIFIIMTTSVFIIRNSISISATEKTRLFGMLCSVGSTPKQLRNSVLYEGLLLTVTGIPLGIAAGVGFTYALVGISGEILKSNLNGNELIFSIPVWALLVSAVLGMLTVFISSLFVAGRAARISPIEAVRLTKETKIGKSGKSYRVPKIIRKLFGQGGSVAWKNMKRSKRQYRTTIVSLILSIVVFLSVSTAIGAAARSAGQKLLETDYNLSVSTSQNTDWDVPQYTQGEERENISERDRNFFEAISQNSYVKTQSYCLRNGRYMFYIPVSDIYKGSKCSVNDIQFFDESEGLQETALLIIALDEEAYKKVIEPTGKTPGQLKGKAVIVNSTRKTVYDDADSSNYTTFYEPFLKEPIGLTLNGRMAGLEFDDIDYDGDRGEISIEIGAELTSDELPHAKYFSNLYQRSGAIIMQIDDYMDTVENWYTYGEMFIDSTDSVKLETEIGDMGYEEFFYVENIDSYVKNMKAIMLVVRIFVYGFIFIITLIGITNIFNTVASNMRFRQKELAMLRSVGMTNREFNGMIILESLFCSAKALLIGLPSGLTLGWTMCFLVSKMPGAQGFIYYFPLVEAILSIIAVMLIIGSIMLYSVSKIRKQNIIETIRNENI